MLYREIIVFRRFSQNCEKRLLASLCLSVHMERLGFHWTDSREIWYVFFFRKSVVKIQISWKSDNNNRPALYMHTDICTVTAISGWILLRTRNVSHKSCTGNQNTQFVFSNVFSPLKTCPLWDNVGKYCRAWQSTDRQYGACALHAGYPRLQTHTQNM